jgi:acylpyruvate hydrolase
MKLATIRSQSGTRAVRVDGDTATEIPGFADVGDLLRAGGLERAASADGAVHPWPEVDLAPVVVNPAKILCVGMNYTAHVKEMGREAPAYPTIFNKWAQALIGARDPILLPPESDQVDWEGELAVIVGKPMRRAGEQEALDGIAGYTILGDTSMRDWQYRTPQWLQGKTWDNSTPVGPVMVTPEELPADAQITTTVDGQVMQHGHVHDLVFGPVDLIRYLSTVLTLEPGDVIATGTPSGVGHARTPPVFLRPGQTVEIAIDGIGAVRNPVVAERV